MVLYKMTHRHLDYPKLIYVKVAGMKVYPRQTWNFRSHAVSACIGLWHHRLMHACHRPMHACTACIAPWHHRLMHVVTARTLLFWFCLGYTHRYRKAKNRLLKFCYVPATSAAQNRLLFLLRLFTVPMKQTRQALSSLYRCLWIYLYLQLLWIYVFTVA